MVEKAQPDRESNNQTIVPSEYAAYQSGFVGRKDYLAQLQALINDNSRSQLLITAPAGYGKSALLAALIAELKIPLLHYSFRWGGTPQNCLLSLIEQTNKYFVRKQKDKYYFGHIDSLRETLMARMEKIKDRHGKCLLLLDDLDLLFAQDKLLCAYPLSIPQDTTLIATSRPNKDLLQRFKELCMEQTVIDLPYLSNNEYQDIFFKVLKIDFSNDIDNAANRSLIFRLNEIFNYNAALTTLIWRYYQHNLDQLSLLTADSIDIAKSHKEVINTVYYGLIEDADNTRQQLKILLLQILTIQIEPLSMDQIIKLLAHNSLSFTKELLDEVVNEWSMIIIRTAKDYLAINQRGLIDLLAGYLNIEKLLLIYDAIISWLSIDEEKLQYYSLNFQVKYLLKAFDICYKIDQQKAIHYLKNAEHLICDFDFIQAKIIAGHLIDLFVDYQEIKERLLISNNNQSHNIDLWLKFLLQEKLILTYWPQLFYQQAINHRIGTLIHSLAQNHMPQSDALLIMLWINRPEYEIYNPLIQNIQSAKMIFYCADLMSDNYTVVTGNENGTVTIWDLKCGQQILTYKAHKGSIFTLKITSDDRYIITGGSDGVITIWDWQNRCEKHRLTGHKASLLSLAINADNSKIFSGSSDRQIKVWQIEDGNLLTEFNIDAPVQSITLTPDNNTLIAGCSEGYLYYFSINNKDNNSSLQNRSHAHNYGITTITVTPDSKYLISAGEDRNIKIWDINNHSEVAKLATLIGSARSLLVTQDGKYIIAGGNTKLINIWSLESGLPITTFSGHTDFVTALATTSDNSYLITTSRDRNIRIWRTDFENLKNTDNFHKSSVTAVAITSDGNIGISGDLDGILKLWHCIDGTELFSTIGHNGTINSIIITPDNHFAITASSDRLIKIWDLETNQLIDTLTGHLDRVLVVGITSDQHLLISGSDDKTIRLWDFETRSLITSLKDTSGVYAIALTSDNQYLGTANSEGKLKLWDLSNRTKMREQRGCYDRGVATTRDGRYSIKGCEDNILKIIDIRTDEEVAIFPTMSKVIDCAVSMEGLVICGDQLGQIYFLQLQLINS